MGTYEGCMVGDADATADGGDAARTAGPETGATGESCCIAVVVRGR